MYALKNGRTKELLFLILCQRNIPAVLLEGGRLLQLVLENIQTKAHSLYQMSVPTSLEALLYFHAMSLIRREVSRKKLILFETRRVV